MAIPITTKETPKTVIPAGMLNNPIPKEIKPRPATWIMDVIKILLNEKLWK